MFSTCRKKDQLESLRMFHFDFFYNVMFPQLGNIMLSHLRVPDSFLAKGDLRDICKIV
jgi:hypothetical protein